MARTLSNPYQVLGVPASATAEDIKSAYRRLALKYHPDRNPGDAQAAEQFKTISEAYATLRDPDARRRFDLYGQARPDMSRPDFSTVDWQTLFREADIHIDWSSRGAVPRTGNAVFDVLFGAMTGLMRTSGLLPGEDRAVMLELDLEEARRGVARRVRIPGPSVCAQCRGGGLVGGAACLLCGGRGALRGGAEVEVNVPARVKDGAKLRLRGLGGPGRPPGDAYVGVSVRLPSGVARVGNTLYFDLPVTAKEAVRGTVARVLGLFVEVPPGSREGRTIRVPEGGLAGEDLVVTLKISGLRGFLRRVRHVLREA